MQRVVRLDTDRGERGLLFAGQVLVEKGERDARAIVGERFGAHAPDFFLVSRFSGSRGDVTEHLPASVLDHALCHVEGVGQHAPDMAIVITFDSYRLLVPVVRGRGLPRQGATSRSSC